MMDIKAYWNDRAATDKARPTTNDVHFRELERRTLIEQLRARGCHAGSRVLDIGCGDGLTLAAIGDAFGCHLTGIDYSAEMLGLVQATMAAHPGLAIDARVADVKDLAAALGEARFDFITTDRCLINLETTEAQLQAVRDIGGFLKPGGAYLAIENFDEGQAKLNELRGSFELPEIAVRWHNHFFAEPAFREAAQGIYASVEKIDFASAYYFATRVIYSKLCALDGKAPDYAHPIHELSVALPFFGDFSPVKMFVLTR